MSIFCHYKIQILPCINTEELSAIFEMVHREHETKVQQMLTRTAFKMRKHKLSFPFKRPFVKVAKTGTHSFTVGSIRQIVFKHMNTKKLYIKTKFSTKVNTRTFLNWIHNWNILVALHTTQPLKSTECWTPFEVQHRKTRSVELGHHYVWSQASNSWIKPALVLLEE